MTENNWGFSDRELDLWARDRAARFHGVSPEQVTPEQIFDAKMRLQAAVQSSVQEPSVTEAQVDRAIRLSGAPSDPVNDPGWRQEASRIAAETFRGYENREAERAPFIDIVVRRAEERLKNTEPPAFQVSEAAAHRKRLGFG